MQADDPETAVSRIIELVQTRIAKRFGLDPIRDIQVLCPMNRGGVGTRSLNIELQAALNPAGDRKVERFGWTFAPGDNHHPVRGAEQAGRQGHRGRGVFKSVAELKSDVMEYLENHNADPKPFIWTKSADEILVARAQHKAVAKRQLSGSFLARGIRPCFDGYTRRSRIALVPLPWAFRRIGAG